MQDSTSEDYIFDTVHREKTKTRIGIAVLFWIVLLSIHLIRVLPFVSSDKDDLWGYLETLLITYSLDIITFSVAYFVLIPLFIEKRKRVLVVSLTLFYFFLYGFVWGWVYELAGRIDDTEGFLTIYKSSTGHTFLQIVYALVLFLSVDWHFKRKRQKQLEAENTSIHLALLKAQINPHFMFNVLNNMHAMVHKDPDLTADSIIKLSHIMRYMLHESEQEWVPLDKEIDHIRSYLSLQEIRLIDKNTVRFDVTGDTEGIQVAPLIFIAFVENAFKHGRKNQPDSIVMHIEVKGDELYFSCINKMRNLSVTEEESDGKIGLSNIKKRLHLIYPNKHELQTTNDGTTFSVKLNINLK